MPPKKKPTTSPAKKKTEKFEPQAESAAPLDEPRVYTADIYVADKLVSSVSLKAGSAGAAQIASYRLIKVKINESNSKK